MVLVLLFGAVDTPVAYVFVMAICPCTTIGAIIPVQTDRPPPSDRLVLAGWTLGITERG